jgi:hypothetical protein
LGLWECPGHLDPERWYYQIASRVPHHILLYKHV